jgi:hypothetical protein
MIARSLLSQLMQSLYARCHQFQYFKVQGNNENFKVLKLVKWEQTEPWWLSALMCQSIINPMLKVENSNPGASILKFGLQFSKWWCLDKNNNLRISIALLVLND